MTRASLARRVGVGRESSGRDEFEFAGREQYCAGLHFEVLAAGLCLIAIVVHFLGATHAWSICLCAMSVRIDVVDSGGWLQRRVASRWRDWFADTAVG